MCYGCEEGARSQMLTHVHKAGTQVCIDIINSMKLVIQLHEKRVQTMLWHHSARVNSHQRWKQTRFRVCFHLWCELTPAFWRQTNINIPWDLGVILAYVPRLYLWHVGWSYSESNPFIWWHLDIATSCQVISSAHATTNIVHMSFHALRRLVM